jgi:hypothetical protein
MAQSRHEAHKYVCLFYLFARLCQHIAHFQLYKPLGPLPVLLSFHLHPGRSLVCIRRVLVFISFLFATLPSIYHISATYLLSMRCFCIICLPYICHLLAIHLPFTCYTSAIYLLYICHLLAICLPSTCYTSPPVCCFFSTTWLRRIRHLIAIYLLPQCESRTSLLSWSADWEVKKFTHRFCSIWRFLSMVARTHRLTFVSCCRPS